jgi:hypothetical protein
MVHDASGQLRLDSLLTLANLRFFAQLQKNKKTKIKIKTKTLSLFEAF